MIIAITALSVIAVAGVAVGIYQISKVGSEPINVIKDFKTAKLALAEFKKEHLNKCDKLIYLKKYIEKEADLDYKRYSITSDERFFVVHKAGKLDYKEYIEKVGGRSYFENDTLYLSFLQFKVSKVEAVAAIKMFPNKDITTTTVIEWSTDGTVIEDDIIKNTEWKNKETTYSQSGLQKVECRVQDINENWSEWTSVEFEVKEVKGIKSLVAGEDYLMILNKSGKLEGYGRNQYGQMATGGQINIEERRVIEGLPGIKSIACGESHIICRDFKGQVYACGSNSFGQLGIGSRLNIRSLQKIWGLERVVQIAAGKDFSAAVLVSGAILTWGQNENGQLGNEKVSFQEIPKRVPHISNVKQVSLGHNHMLCLLHDGTVMAWGDNSYGQIGNGYTGKTTEPSVVEVKNVNSVVAGRNFSIAVLKNGKMFGWGNNNVGQLGITAEPVVVFPKEIPGVKNIIKADAMDSFVVALNEIGEVYTWGRYQDIEEETITKAVKMDGLKYVKDVAASYTEAFILKENDEISSWSTNIDFHKDIVMNEKPHERYSENNKE